MVAASWNRRPLYRDSTTRKMRTYDCSRRVWPCVQRLAGRFINSVSVIRVSGAVVVLLELISSSVHTEVRERSFTPNTLCFYVWSRVKKDLVAASAEPLVLSLLSRGESYGYAIIQSLHAVSREKIEWTDGMLYPVLHRIEGKGWIKSRWVEAESGRKRKYYRLTARGEKALAEQRDDWTTVNSTLATLWKENHV